jgi:hypothetical protein
MSWAPAGPERYRIYDTAPQNPAVSDSGLSALPTPSAGAANTAKALHPDNPLFVYGALAALTFGFMAFSTSGSIRVGKTTLKAGLGIGNA